MQRRLPALPFIGNRLAFFLSFYLSLFHFLLAAITRAVNRLIQNVIILNESHSTKFINRRTLCPCGQPSAGAVIYYKWSEQRASASLHCIGTCPARSVLSGCQCKIHISTDRQFGCWLLSIEIDARDRIVPCVHTNVSNWLSSTRARLLLPLRFHRCGSRMWFPFD